MLNHLVFFFFFFFFSKVRVGAKEGGSHYWEMAVAITCGYGGYLLPLLAAHSSSRWSRGHVCAGFCKSTLGTREFCEMAFQNSGNFILEFWWDPWTKLSYIEMVDNNSRRDLVLSQQPSGQVLSCFNCHHRGYLNDPIFWNLELHASGIVTVILLEFMLNQTTEINYEWN